jgi:ferrochelatase
LEPDINDHLRALHHDGVRRVAVVPIGFISDHMEVVFDLDTEAAATARELGVAFVRASTAGLHPSFVTALVDLLAERAKAARGEPYRPAVIPAPIPGGAAGWLECPAHCCPNLRAPDRAALCQTPAGQR